MSKAGCGKIVMCVVSKRKSLADWASRRGFSQTAASPFPVDAVPFEVVESERETLQLLVFEKALVDKKEKQLRKAMAMEKLSIGDVVHDTIVDDGMLQEKAELSVFEEADACLMGLSFKAGGKEKVEREEEEREKREKEFRELNEALKIA